MNPDREWPTAKKLLAALSAGAILLFAWLIWPRQAKPPLITAPSTNSVLMATEPDRRLQTADEALRRASDVREVRQTLAALSEFLSTRPAAEASSAMQGHLRRGTDFPTGLGFELQANGFLSAWPTLRIFLLDHLAKVDREAAATYAKDLLHDLNSPDEWALCLRNLALADTSGATRALLEEKVSLMLRHEPWQQNPSAGFLEAFDVAVYVGGTKLMPVLTDLVRRTNNQAVAHAAYLALDRLTIQDPAHTLAALQAAPEWMRGREVIQANYFARADVREARERQVLEEYLLSAARTGAELQTFAGLYPNANLMVSHNLLTVVKSPGRAELVGRDIAALRVAEEWLGDPRFQQLKPHLEKVRIRLEGFVSQARASP